MICTIEGLTMFAVKPSLLLATALAFAASAALAQASKPSDPQIAHIAYTAGQIDIAAGKQALAKSTDKQVRDFADEMVRDHTAVNDQALALVKKLGVTPQDNPTSQGMAALITKPGDSTCKDYDPNGYIQGKKVPQDPWGHDFIYICDDGKHLILKSLGPDGKEGEGNISSEEL